MYRSRFAQVVAANCVSMKEEWYRHIGRGSGSRGALRSRMVFWSRAWRFFPTRARCTRFASPNAELPRTSTHRSLRMRRAPAGLS